MYYILEEKKNVLFDLGMGLGGTLLLPITEAVVGIAGAKDIIPPSEGGGVVSNKGLMMVIMVFGPSPAGENVTERPRKVIAAVGVNGLHET